MKLKFFVTPTKRCSPASPGHKRPDLPRSRLGSAGMRLLVLNKDLADGFFMELPKTGYQQQNIECRQSRQDQRNRQVRELRHQRCPQSFAGIGEWVEENNFLQDGKL